MKITNIEIYTCVDDIEDGEIDLCVTLEDGRSYILVVWTPKYILALMNDELLNDGHKDFVSPCEPRIIVTKLTEEIIEKAIEAYAEKDKGYYLKFYGASFDTETLDVLKEREIARKKWLDELDEAGKIEDYDHIDLIDFDINNL